MTYKLAVAAPLTVYGEGDREGNLAIADNLVKDAVKQGASIVCFPETFPGAWRAPVTWTPVEELGQIARDNNVYLMGSFAEPADSEGQQCYVAASLFDPSGKELGRYHRLSPALSPWVYADGPLWDFTWIQKQQSPLPVIDTDLGKIGMLVCSEVYVPELSRALALQGAEVILMPSGVTGPNRALYETWKTLIFARAIENLAYVATSANITYEGDRGLAMVCSPEDILLLENGPGVFVTDVDLDRVRWLRNEEDRRIGTATPWKVKPGLLRDWYPTARRAADAALNTPVGR